jgi:hypothetical protein
MRSDRLPTFWAGTIVLMGSTTVNDRELLDVFGRVFGRVFGASSGRLRRVFGAGRRRAGGSIRTRRRARRMQPPR